MGYFLFEGEQHGFRKAENIKRALDAELYFYAALVLRSGLHFSGSTPLPQDRLTLRSIA